MFALVGDGSYLMMAQEIVTAVSEGIKLNRRDRAEPRLRLDRRAVESLGSQRFGTNYRYRDPATGMLTATSCRSTSPRTRESLGAEVIRVKTIEEFRAALARPAPPTSPPPSTSRPTRSRPSRSSESWWDVPVAEVAALDSTQQARKAYEVHKRDQQAPDRRQHRP